MNNVQLYLTERYNYSKWHYHGVNTLFYDLREQMTKDEIRAEIRQLKADKMIDIVPGINGWLVEIKNIELWH